MNIKVIGEYRFTIEEGLNLLAHIDSLPSMAELDSMAVRLKKLAPYDVVASIYEDTDYKANKQIYINAFGGVLNCDTFSGYIYDNGEIIDYWSGMVEKLESQTAIDDLDAYTEKVLYISGLIGENIRGMRKDLAEVFEDTKLFAKRTQGRHKGAKSRVLPDRVVQDSDFPTDRVEYKTYDFRATEINLNACKLIQRCVFNNVLEEKAEGFFLDNLLEKALKTASPDIVSNGNRLDILAFLFRKYSEGYIKDDEQRKDYWEKCCARINKKWEGSNFDTASPESDIQIKIWDKTRRKFKK